MTVHGRRLLFAELPRTVAGHQQLLAHYQAGDVVLIADWCVNDDACPMKGTPFGSAHRRWSPDGLEPRYECAYCGSGRGWPYSVPWREPCDTPGEVGG